MCDLKDRRLYLEVCVARAACACVPLLSFKYCCIELVLALMQTQKRQQTLPNNPHFDMELWISRYRAAGRLCADLGSGHVGGSPCLVLVLFLVFLIDSLVGAVLDHSCSAALPFWRLASKTQSHTDLSAISK